MAAYSSYVFVIGVFIGLFQSINCQIKTDLSIVSVLNPPYLYQNKDGSFSGFFPDLLKSVAQIAGFNFTITLSQDNRYGSLDNGSWNGIMKEVTDGTVDIGGPLTVTSTRAQFVDFTYPVQYIGHVFVMKRPESDRPSLTENLSKLLYPLEFSVWLMAFLALLVTGTVLYIISHFNPYEWRRMAKDREATLREAESFTCLNSFFFVVSTLMWQGYVRAPRSVGARVMVVAWWSFTVVFLLTYTASLTNYLRTRPEPFAVKGYSKIRSFRDVGAHSEIRVGMLPSGATEAHYRLSTSPTDMKIYEKFQEEKERQKEDNSSLNNINALEDYLRQRKYSDYAVILESPTARFITSKEPCDIYMISEGSAKNHIALATKIGSNLKKPIDQALMTLHESGALGHIESKWFSPGCKETVYQPTVDDGYVDSSSFNQLDLGTFSSALLIIVVGIVLGGLISIIEICIFKCAETHIDEDEVEPISNRNSKIYEPNASEQLLNHDPKKGGATSV